MDSIFRRFDTFVIRQLRGGLKYALLPGWDLVGYAPEVAAVQDGEYEYRVAVVYRIRLTAQARHDARGVINHE
jgi:hypothetical protein